MTQPPPNPNEELTFRLSLIRLLTEPHVLASPPAFRTESSQIEEWVTKLPPPRFPAGRAH